MWMFLTCKQPEVLVLKCLSVCVWGGGAFAVIATTKNRLTSVTARGIMLPGSHKRGGGKYQIRKRNNQRLLCNVNFVAHNGERKGKKGRKERERAHGRPNISSSKNWKGRVGLSWESSGGRSAAAHRGRAKLTGLKKTHWMSTWTNVYVFFSSFFFLSKQLNCTDLNISFLLIKKTGLFRSPENSMSLARANKITMNADPSRLDGILPMKDVFLLWFLINQVEEKWFVLWKERRLIFLLQPISYSDADLGSVPEG